MANTIIYGIKISLGAEYTQDTTIGLYTASGTSYLRWSEATLSGVSTAYTSGFILSGGIGAIQEKSDLSRGGNIAQYSGFNFKVANAELLSGSLVDLGIYLVGLPVELIRYEGTYADSDVSTTVDFTGIIESTEWNETELNINCKNSRYKRNAVITTTNTDGITTPVTFGSLFPPSSTVINNLAKFVRTVDTKNEQIYDSSFFCGYLDYQSFPIDSGSGSSYVFRLPTNTILPNTTLVSDCYCIVVDGGTNEPNQIREVTAFSKFVIGDTDQLAFTLKTVFEYPLTSSGENRAWVRFIQNNRLYSADIQPCKSFLDKNGSPILTPELYSFDSTDNQFKKITDSAYTIESTDNNELNIDGQFSSDDFDKIQSFNIYPVTSFAKTTSATVTFNAETYTKVTSLSVTYDGVYAKTWHPTEHGVTAFTASNLTDVYDREKISFSSINLQCSKLGLTSQTFFTAACFDFTMPSILDTGFDNIYIGLKFTMSNVDVTATGFEVTLKRFAYEKASDSDREIISGTNSIDMDNFPDSYWTDGVYETTNNRFFVDSSTSSGGTQTISGYTRIAITADELKYKSYRSGTIKFQMESTSEINKNPQISITLREIAIIIKKSDMTVEKQIFTPFQGRIFNDDFQDSRKTPTDLIENPIDIIEHCKRLQNWSEIYNHSPISWGQVYSDDALIKLSGDGSFDSANLDILDTETCAFQVFDADKASTDVIVKRICDTYNVGSYIDSSGNECVETIDQLVAPSESISLSDIIGEIGSVTEPNPSNVYAEPVVKYLYNAGSEKYDAQLSITNIDKASWISSYTPGYTAADGENVWGLCKVLYNKYRVVEPCPNDFSEQLPIRTYQGAVNYIKRKIAWMDKYRVSINIPYSKGKSYNIFKHVYLQLPYQTNNKNVECIIENISKNKNSGIVSIDLVLLENVETAWYNNATVGQEYQDNASTGTEYNAR